MSCHAGLATDLDKPAFQRQGEDCEMHGGVTFLMRNLLQDCDRCGLPELRQYKQGWVMP